MQSISVSGQCVAAACSMQAQLFIVRVRILRLRKFGQNCMANLAASINASV